jgi:hypothetical protein
VKKKGEKTKRKKRKIVNRNKVKQKTAGRKILIKKEIKGKKEDEV